MAHKWLRFPGTARSFPAIDPAAPFSVLGDLHGRADLLTRFLNQAPDRQIICVGDYVDRGNHSAEVLRILMAHPDIICLSGNHEDMLLSFLEAPETEGARWLRFGGLQTLASFGVGGVTEHSGTPELRRARDDLVAAMGEDLHCWLRDLPTYWQSGNVAVVHAGADPAVAIVNQPVETLHWGHPDFARRVRRDGVWVVHGHIIVETPQIRDGRISIDTGAYATGRLTISHIDSRGVTFDEIT